MIKNNNYTNTAACVVFCLLLLFVGNVSAHGTKDKELISPADLALEGDGHQILDLRSQEAFQKGHVPGAYPLPLQELSESRLKAFGIASGDQIILYGVSESSAGKGKLLLGILGYEKVRILAGGFTHWQEDGQQIEEGSVRPSGNVISEVSRSELMVIPDSHDFGIIQKKSGIVTTTFKVQNTSSSEISIHEITTSCGCTSAEIETDIIPPGETSILTVYFDPDFHKEPGGKFSRTVFLETSENIEIQAKIEVEIAK